MRGFKGKSIRFKFATALIAAVTSIMVIFSLAIIVHNVRAIESQLAQRMGEASRLAKVNLSSALWQFNHDFVDDFVNSLFLYEDVVFVCVFSGDDVVKRKVSPGIPKIDFKALMGSADYITKESIIEYGDQPIGKIQIGLTRERIRDTIYNNTRAGILLLLFIIVAILLTNLLITRRILFNPIEKLENSASQIAQGDLDTPIDVSGTDEIGQLAKSFDHMIQNIKEVTASRDELNHEIQRRIHTESALRRERDRAQNYLDIAGVILVVIDSGQKVVLINKRGCKILELPEEAILGCNWFETFLPTAKQNVVKDSFNRIVAGKADVAEYYENEIVTRTGETRLIAWHNTLLKDKMGKIIGTLSSGEDVTERKKAEERLVASLKDKEFLLKEIHHRVKNNMQMIQSMISLQADKIKNQEYKQPLIESNNRIRAMALVHENLYRSKKLSNLDMQKYFNDLVGQLVRAYGNPEKAIELSVNIEPLRLNIDKLIACGLIVNELATNSLKYAFVNCKQGHIDIVLQKIDSEQIGLIVSDNGAGFKKDFNIEAVDSLGLRLVWILAESQLQGQITVNQNDGLSYSILFPNPDNPKKIELS